MAVEMENGCVCALSILVSVLVLSPLCGLPGSITNDFPSTLRATALVLISLLSAPPLFRDSNRVLEQRLFLAACVAGAALAAENRGEGPARAIDALFIFVALSSCVISSVSNGLSNGNKSNDDTTQSTNENICSLFGALLFYTGVRLVRDAFALPQETLSFAITKMEFNVRGFALVDEMVLATKAINGTLFACVGLIVLLQHNNVLKYGVAAVARTCRAIACLSFVTTFVSQLVAFHDMSLLPAIFSDDACLVGEACEVANRSRRHYIASSMPFVSLGCTLALGVFSLPKAHQRTKRKHSLEPNAIDGTTLVCLGVAAMVPILVVLGYAGAEISQLEIELLLSLLAIGFASTNGPVIACVLYLVSGGLHIWRAGMEMTVITDLAFVLSSACVGLLLILIGTNSILYSFADRLYSDLLERLCGILLTTFVSLNVLLFLGSLVLFSSATGALRTGETTLMADGLTYNLEHFLPVFFAGSLYAVRHESSTLGWWWSRLGYFVPVLLAVLVYLVVASVRADGGTSMSYAGYSPIEAYVDVFSLAVGTVSAVASWASVGVFL